MPIDLFARMRPDAKLHSQYLKTRDDPRMAPARAMLREVAATMEDPDGNFVEQFQTQGFDARTFEIYLNALFAAEGFDIDRSHDRPDFLISRDGRMVAVEAVTANPTPTKEIRPYEIFPAAGPRTAEETQCFLKNEIAIRLGSPLYSKLQKRYWELPHVVGKPLVFAIQNFHAGGLSLSSTGMSQYLFGVDHSHYFGEDGNLVVEGKPVATHEGSKTIPSNFFAQPGAEHVSAVLFCNGGTITKFNRIGHEGKHRSDAVRMVRFGTCLDHDPNATQAEVFDYEVGDPRMPPESWRDGAILIRNPAASIPLPAGWMGMSAEEDLVGGQVVTSWRDPFLPFESLTHLFDGGIDDETMWAVIDRHLAMRRLGQMTGDQWRDELD